MNNENVKKDAINLCLEALRTRARHKDRGEDSYRLIAMEMATNEHDNDLLYSERETPQLLQNNGILSLFHIFHKELENHTVKGLYTVQFNYDKAEEWIKKHIQSIYRDDFRYENNQLHLKLANGDFYTALSLMHSPELRPIFESFYFLYIDTGRKLFTRDEILKKYKSLTGKSITWQELIKQKSSFGKLINRDAILKERLIWKHAIGEMYHFELLAPQIPDSRFSTI